MKKLNKKYGNWTVGERDLTNTSHDPYYICTCDCGTVRSVKGSRLRDGKSLSCGCSRNRKNELKPGEIFNRWTIVKLSDTKTRSDTSAFYWCKCECGNEGRVRARDLITGHSKSCGCLRLERLTSIRGEAHHLYDPTISREERDIAKYRWKLIGYTDFQREVLRRNGYKCDLCGSTKKLVSHHLNNFSEHKEGRMDPENCICLCSSCHIAFHSLYGKKTVKENYLEYKERMLSNELESC